LDYGIETRTLRERTTAVVLASLPAAGLSDWLPGAYQEVVGYLGRVGVAPSGPPFARYTFHDDLVEVEAGFPVTRPVVGEGRVVPSSLPGGPAAVTTHFGTYEGLEAAYEAVSTWLKEHGHEASGPHWEVYYTDPRTQPDRALWRTDLVTPLLVG
jgi:effector-binding domain-containing protein